MTEHNRPSRSERAECEAAWALQLGLLQTQAPCLQGGSPEPPPGPNSSVLGSQNGADQPPEGHQHGLRWLEGGAGPGPACPHQASPPHNQSGFSRADKTTGSDGTNPTSYTTATWDSARRWPGAATSCKRGESHRLPGGGGWGAEHGAQDPAASQVGSWSCRSNPESRGGNQGPGVKGIQGEERGVTGDGGRWGTGTQVSRCVAGPLTPAAG